MAGYIIAPFDKVKGEGQWPEFNDVRKQVENAVRERAKTLWAGYVPGGVLPTGNQYGVGPIPKNEMAGDTSDSSLSGSYSFIKNIAAGWQDIFNYNVSKDNIHGFAGFAVTDPVLRFSQFRMQVGDTLMPIVDLNEAQLYDRFAILLKTDVGKELVADPNTKVIVRIYGDTAGNQRVIPLGIRAYKSKDRVISET